LSLGFWLIRGSALGPIGGLSTRQFNSCLPRREENKNERKLTDAKIELYLEWRTNRKSYMVY